MKFIFSRVNEAKVAIPFQERTIKDGLLVFVAFMDGDQEKDYSKIASKILNIRLFDEHKSFSSSIIDLDLELLIIPNFSLYAKLDSRRPEFRKALSATKAEELFNKLFEALNNQFPGHVRSGFFGTEMKVSSIMDGPLNIIYEC